MRHGDGSSVAFIGNYLPRRCGIATFTTDLCRAVAHDASCMAVAVNDLPDAYDYPSTVRFTIDENDICSYHRAAESLNTGAVDVVSLQHEYGIFGGSDGRYILSLLERLRIPVVTTLHTVERNPTFGHREVLERLTFMSDRVVVMSRRGATFLEGIYRVPADKIGLSPPLIETSEGWLMIYHGVRATSAGAIYRLGLALFDIDEPERCLLRGKSWIFGPQESYERDGDVSNVVFPCGYTVDPDGDTINIYYGAADTCVALATESIHLMLDWLHRHGEPARDYH
ncbi:MAG: glycosyltransferase [Phycisphaerae bacterium]